VNQHPATATHRSVNDRRQPHGGSVAIGQPNVWDPTANANIVGRPECRPDGYDTRCLVNDHSSAARLSQTDGIEPIGGFGPDSSDRDAAVTRTPPRFVEVPSSGGLPIGGRNGTFSNHVFSLAQVRLGEQLQISGDPADRSHVNKSPATGPTTDRQRDDARDATRDRALTAAIEALAASSQAQSEAMLSLSRSTAESVRLAAGSYVFALRDRFDESLPVTQLGASESNWIVADFPDAFAQLVFHPGDSATVAVRLALSQASVGRTVRARWDLTPAHATHGSFEYTAAHGHHREDGGYLLTSDISLFIGTPLDIAVGDLPLGQFEAHARVIIEVTNTRPEGAVAVMAVDVTVRGLVVQDDDGVGLDLATVDCHVRPEKRTYWLDKDEQLPLQLPRLG
jgi:hypothetical protein